MWRGLQPTRLGASRTKTAQAEHAAGKVSFRVIPRAGLRPEESPWVLKVKRMRDSSAKSVLRNDTISCISIAWEGRITETISRSVKV
jgi:hypothetical protein